MEISRKLDGTTQADPEIPAVNWNYRYEKDELHITRKTASQVQQWVADYVIGSGHHALTYVSVIDHKIPHVLEHRLTVYHSHADRPFGRAHCNYERVRIMSTTVFVVASDRSEWQMKDLDMPRPSEVELAILHVLWEQGPSTVREVHEQVGKARKTGYTTVLKLMQIMAAKGMVERDVSRRSHVYRALMKRTRTQRRLLADLLHRAFRGSSRDLVMQALSANRASPAEIAEIRALLDTIEKKGGADEFVHGGNA